MRPEEVDYAMLVAMQLCVPVRQTSDIWKLGHEAVEGRHDQA